MGLLIFLVFSYVLLSLSLYFVFEKVGEAGWKGLVPGLNFVVWSKLIGRSPYYPLWLLVPIVNIFAFVGMCIDLVRSFGKYSFWHSVLAVVYPPAFFFYLGLNKEEKFIEPAWKKEQEYLAQLKEAMKKGDKRSLRKLQQSPYAKSTPREWVESIIFAVFAAAFIRMFLIEAYMIPTSSMEGTLLVGDYLFVSKIHYGLRMPMTVIQIPLLHNRIPGIGEESYLKKPQLPYKRLPAIQKIKRNDIVVFNYPEGDSVYITPHRTYSIYDKRRNPENLRPLLRGKKLVTRPIDKKDHYVKRCVAIAGDSLQIIDRQLYINGQKAPNPKYIQFIYAVTFSQPVNTSSFAQWGISREDLKGADKNNPLKYYIVLNREQIEKLKSLDPQLKVEVMDFAAYSYNPHQVFPYAPQFFPDWTIDNYGPIYVPKAGSTIALTPQNVVLYQRLIEVYEGNKLSRHDGKFFINDQAAETYTFKKNYYWMMGDNRHGSEDSRYWGFVPEDHIVGKPLFIFFSKRSGDSFWKSIRWNRLFKSANSF